MFNATFKYLLQQIFANSSKIRRIKLETTLEEIPFMWLETDKPPQKFYFPVSQEDQKAFLGTLSYHYCQRLWALMEKEEKLLARMIGLNSEATIDRDLGITIKKLY